MKKANVSPQNEATQGVGGTAAAETLQDQALPAGDSVPRACEGQVDNPVPRLRPAGECAAMAPEDNPFFTLLYLMAVEKVKGRL